MKLSQILKSVPGVAGNPSENGDPEITGIQYRSDRVTPGDLFVAVPGFKKDGHDYIGDACIRGAAAVAAQKYVPCDAPLVQVENARIALAAAAAAFYRNPSESLFMIGVTGTNGKTTTSYLIENILLKAGLNPGVIGTINYRYAGKTVPNPMTTPESLDLQRILAEMLQNGVTHVVTEVTSHALDLHRTAFCRFDIGVFTNLTQDHLDYHKDMDSYWNCKRKLFTELLPANPEKSRTAAVINCSHPKGCELIRELEIPVIAVSTDGSDSILQNLPPASLSVRATDAIIGETGIRGTIQTPAGSFRFRSPLTGLFNLENILCAAGTGIAMRLPSEVVRDGIETMPAVPGRLEYIPNDQNKHVFADYAHTPDALENVLNTLRNLAKQKIVTVFGCGGDRDKAKRPKMGEIAGRLSDFVIITSDNPRTEHPSDIIRQIVPGVLLTCPVEYSLSDLNSGFDHRGFVIIPDRKTAIRTAIRISCPGDIVLIAGKGHEPYQIIGTETVLFDDRQEAREALLIKG